MIKKDFCITDRTDIFVYFEIIRQVGAKRVLDAGAFLKRIGSVSRQVGDLMLPGDIVIDAVEMRGAPMLPVYNTVYNHIYEAAKLPVGEYFDIAMLLRTKDSFDAKRIMSLAGAILTDDYTYKILMQKGTFGRGVQDVTVDDHMYKLVVR